MKTCLPNLLGAAIRDYFMDHLPRLRGTSPHTIHSYRDNIVLLLRFLSRQQNTPVTALNLTDLDPPGILAFLLPFGTGEKLGHVAIIDTNPRRGEKHEMEPHRAQRYKQRSSSERVNANLKDNYGGRFVRVRGTKKVMAHLMFGVIALTASQLFQLLL